MALHTRAGDLFARECECGSERIQSSYPERRTVTPLSIHVMRLFYSSLQVHGQRSLPFTATAPPPPLDAGLAFARVTNKVPGIMRRHRWHSPSTQCTYFILHSSSSSSGFMFPCVCVSVRTGQGPQFGIRCQKPGVIVLTAYVMGKACCGLIVFNVINLEAREFRSFSFSFCTVLSMRRRFLASLHLRA